MLPECPWNAGDGHVCMWKLVSRKATEGACRSARPSGRQARPEPRLAVVTHSSFLFYMLSTVGSQCDARVKGELHRWCAVRLNM
jgi:hypothetical protein